MNPVNQALAGIHAGAMSTYQTNSALFRTANDLATVTAMQNTYADGLNAQQINGQQEMIDNLRQEENRRTIANRSRQNQITEMLTADLKAQEQTQKTGNEMMLSKFKEVGDRMKN